jgi:hypothetical protein
MPLPLRALAPALAVLVAAPLAAQQQPAAQQPSAAPAARAGTEEAAVLAVVTRLFDAMRAGDSAAVRAVFHPQAQLGSALVRPDGTPVVRTDSVGSFVRSIGAPHPEVLDERLRNTLVHVDGPLASVWTGYGFFLGQKFSHCGVDAFHLARTAEGWRIVSLFDTRQRTGCPEQAAAAGMK